MKKTYRSETPSPVPRFICTNNSSFDAAQHGSTKDPTNQRSRRVQADVQYASKFVCPRPQINPFIRLQKNQSIWDYYRIDTNDSNEEVVLGQGAHGSVVQVVHKVTHVKRAIKTIYKGETTSGDTRTQREVLVMQRLEHPNIMKTYETYEDEDNVYVVMELLKGGELFDILRVHKRISAPDISNITRQLLSALNYAHENNVCHRDIKLENVVFLNEQGPDMTKNDLTLKIIDWGFACKFAEYQRDSPPDKLPFKTTVGTPFYVAPEVISQNYDFRSDLWSLGVVVYCMLTGTPPFNGDSPRDIMKKIVDENFHPVYEGNRWANVPRDAKSFVKGLLTRDLDLRLTVEEALNHPFINKYNVSKDVSHAHGSFVLDRMREYSEKPFVAQLISQIIVFCGLRSDIELSTAEIEGRPTLRQLFELFDGNNRGCLLLIDLLDTFAEAGVKIGRKDVLELMHQIDSSGNGTVDYLEFLAMMITDWTEAEVENAFNILDVSGDCLIDAQDLYHWLGTAKLARRSHEGGLPITIETMRTPSTGIISENVARYRRHFEEFIALDFPMHYGKGYPLEMITSLLCPVMMSVPTSLSNMSESTTTSSVSINLDQSKEKRSMDLSTKGTKAPVERHELPPPF